MKYRCNTHSTLFSGGGCVPGLSAYLVGPRLLRPGAGENRRGGAGAEGPRRRSAAAGLPPPARHAPRRRAAPRRPPPPARAPPWRPRLRAAAPGASPRQARPGPGRRLCALPAGLVLHLSLQRTQNRSSDVTCARERAADETAPLSSRRRLQPCGRKRVFC